MNYKKLYRLYHDVIDGCMTHDQRATAVKIRILVAMRAKRLARFDGPSASQERPNFFAAIQET